MCVLGPKLKVEVVNGALRLVRGTGDPSSEKSRHFTPPVGMKRRNKIRNPYIKCSLDHLHSLRESFTVDNNTDELTVMT